MDINDSLTVRFDNGQNITVDGTLNVMGTGSILFTRYEPDDHWNGLLFHSDSSGGLHGCTIEQVTDSAERGIHANSEADTAPQYK